LLQGALQTVIMQRFFGHRVQYDKYTTYTPLKSFEELLKESHFEKISRNVLINTQAIRRINLKENLIEIDRYTLPISRTNKQNFIDKHIDKAL
jgi:DNA-binding LytR/AlgR family response regulator